MKTKLLQEIHKQIPKKQEKYIKNITLERSTHVFPVCGPKHTIYVSHERFQFLKKMQKKKFSMPLHWINIDGLKSDLYLLLYGPLEPMLINFTCDLSFVCIPPR